MFEFPGLARRAAAFCAEFPLPSARSRMHVEPMPTGGAHENVAQNLLRYCIARLRLWHRGVSNDRAQGR